MGSSAGKNDAEALPPKDPKEKPPPPEYGGLSKQKVLNAAKEDSLQDDWGCLKAPPWANDRLPGIRYGSSIEMRPLTMLNPCPCAGGVWTPPHADDGGELDAGGLWHFPRDRYPRSAINGIPTPQLTILSNPPPFAPDWKPPSRSMIQKAKEKLGSAKKPTLVGSTAMFSLDVPPGGRAQGSQAGVGPEGGASLDAASGDVGDAGTHLAGTPKSHKFSPDSFGMMDMVPDPYFAGSEPYAIDYGCASAGKHGLLEAPGKRWKDVPSWTALAVATPCPCALGTYSAFNPPQPSRTPSVPDSVWVTPGLGATTQVGAAPWQGNSNTMLGNMGATSAVLALASTLILGASTPRQACTSSDARRRARSTPSQRRHLQEPWSGAAFL